MEARHSFSSTVIPNDRMRHSSEQQEASVSLRPLSQSSQTDTVAPSGTGASGQSVTTHTEHVTNDEQSAYFHQLVITFLPK